MTVVVSNNNFGVSAFKVRKVADLVRRKSATDALNILRFCDKKEIAIALSKLIKSGLAVAENRNVSDIENLAIKALLINEGPTIKRIMPRAQGRAYRIAKRSSHIVLELESLSK